MVYDFERAAIRGESVPDDLEPADIWLFLALRELYAQVKKGTITREIGATEKHKFKMEYNKLKFDLKLAYSTAELWKNIELRGSEYKKNRTLENADKFYKAVYNQLGKNTQTC